MVSEADAQELLAIYAPYVRETSISFEYEVPSLEEFQARIRKTLVKYPYLAAVSLEGGREEILGYAYASPFHERAAYGWGAEASVYVKMDHRQQGIGSLLYRYLEEILKKQNILNLNACITYPNEGSVGFHRHMGFQQTAHFHQCGFKFNTWYDMIWMEKQLQSHPIPPQPVIPVTELDVEGIIKKLAKGL